jgi:hypothetical protein
VRNVGLKSHVGDKILRGIVTGYNEAFVINDAKKDELIKADPMSAEIIRKIFKGDSLRPWYKQDDGEWILFTRRGIDIEKYPAVLKHLEGFRAFLEPKPEGHKGEWRGRKSGPYEWYEIQDSTVYFEDFLKPKISWPDICKLPRFSLDEEGAFLNNSAYMIPCTSPALLAVLQSRVAWFLISQMATPLRLRGGLWQF